MLYINRYDKFYRHAPDMVHYHFKCRICLGRLNARQIPCGDWQVACVTDWTHEGVISNANAARLIEENKRSQLDRAYQDLRQIESASSEVGAAIKNYRKHEISALYGED